MIIIMMYIILLYLHEFGLCNGKHGDSGLYTLSWRPAIKNYLTHALIYHVKSAHWYLIVWRSPLEASLRIFRILLSFPVHDERETPHAGNQSKTVPSNDHHVYFYACVTEPSNPRAIWHYCSWSWGVSLVSW